MRGIDLTEPASPATAPVGNVASSPVRDLLALTAHPEVISFAGGLPAAESFDLDGWRAAFSRALSSDAGRRKTKLLTRPNSEL